MQIPDKVAVAITALICIMTFSEIFYNAIFVGDLITNASIEDACKIILWYAFPVITAIIIIVLIWWVRIPFFISHKVEHEQKRTNLD